MTDAKPCPWCGFVGVQVREGSSFRWMYAECDGCGVNGPEIRVQTLGEGTREQWWAEGKQDALDAWNLRKARDVDAIMALADEYARASSYATFTYERGGGHSGDKDMAEARAALLEALK